jgi:hypothetical protein
MQTLRESTGFHLEYSEQSQLYRCKDDALSLDWVLSAFRSYGRGDGDWKRTLEWERHEPEQAKSHRLTVVIIVGSS